MTETNRRETSEGFVIPKNDQELMSDVILPLEGGMIKDRLLSVQGVLGVTDDSKLGDDARVYTVLFDSGKRYEVYLQRFIHLGHFTSRCIINRIDSDIVKEKR